MTATMTVGITPPKALRVLGKTVGRNAASQGGEEEVAARAEQQGTGALRSMNARGTEAIILLLDPGISSRRCEEIGDVFDELLDSISHSTGVDGDILGRIVADSIKLRTTYNTTGDIRTQNV
ncbi:hypothetical protein R3P38DRAFT_2779771 [Favolaschia claudopus]|uniref:Uncharacterized protein n=1 Tax=Favolaschia claudopus TaxID=2862362 RepID=A0AAW0BDC9_9AGAR